MQIILAPACARATAAPWPIPDDAPVTNAVFPLKTLRAFRQINHVFSHSINL